MCIELGEAGAALLASRRWPRLWELDLRRARLRAAGAAALACEAWAALEVLDLRANGLGALPTRRPRARVGKVSTLLAAQQM